MESILPQTLPQYFKDIKVVQPGDKVFKDECVCSFDTPESKHGLYICMKNFEAVGHDFLEYHYKRHKTCVYLNHKTLKFKITKPESTDTKPKRLAIGVDGGFHPDASEKEYRYENTYSLLIMPEETVIQLPNVDLPELFLQSIKSIISSQSTENRPNETNVWDGEQRLESKYAKDLKQIPCTRKIPPSGWKCEQCNLKENLWLNLTDGTILCGRRFYDGSGGNNHALEHYDECHYPLAVKLGTITPETADVYSYPEEDMVIDPLLDKHLAHFGIDIQSMTKTEKSMIELEIDMNEKIGEWSLIQEEGKNLKQISGPGFTGLKNLGNSCYMNSVVQVLFSIAEFQKRYTPAREVYETTESIERVNFQMAKLAYGLLSGKYSTPEDESQANEEQKGISPKSFKHFVCGLDRNFSTKRQQDAHEFFLFLLDLIERNSDRGQFCESFYDPTNCFDVVIEDRIQCLASSRVKYTQRKEKCLSIDVDLKLATNQVEVDNYKKAIEDKIEPAPPIVRPNLCLTSLIDSFGKSEIIENFYSSAIQDKTNAQKTSKLAKFPRILVFQIKKFQCGDDWIPKKLDISVDVPEVLDLESLEATGLTPDEEELPETDESGVSSGPIASEPEPSADAIAMLASMGIDLDQAIPALKLCNNDAQRAIEYIFDPESFVPAQSHGADDYRSQQVSSSGIHKPDGQPKLYQLKAFISHMGTSTMSGHYVCHIRKDDNWYIYNDNKVAISENPPKQFGYLYFYERIASF